MAVSLANRPSTYTNISDAITREKRPFAAKLPVQLLFELVYDRAMRSKRELEPGNIRRYLHEMGREEVLQRMDGLAIKWGLDIEAAMQ